jgi:hypothetical protein
MEVAVKQRADRFAANRRRAGLDAFSHIHHPSILAPSRMAPACRLA